MKHFNFNRLDKSIVNRMAERFHGQNKAYVQNGAYNIAFQQRGKAYVPIKPTTSVISRRRRDRLNVGERKMENWEVFQKALLAEPMVFRAILLINKYMVAYGYKYGYINRYRRDIKGKKLKTLEFFEDWDEYIALSYRMFQIGVSMTIYGNAFVEKIYDDNGSDLQKGENGWGVRHIKIIHPLSMFVQRDLYGKIIRYWQKPPSYQGRDLRKIQKMGGLPIDPSRIIHFKWNDWLNETYGTSDLKPLMDTISMKVGMREDAAIMVQQRANPIIAWLVGDMENPPPAGFLSAAAGYLGDNADGSNDLVLPGFIKPEVIGTGQQMPDIVPYLQMFSSEIIKGIGVPEVLLGEGNDTTEATAKIQFESFIGELMFRQKAISLKLRRELFPDVIKVPKRKRKDRQELVSNSYVLPAVFRDTPSIVFSPIMGSLDKMNSSMSQFEKGIIGVDEAREIIGEITILEDEQKSATIRKIEAEIEQIDKNIDMTIGMQQEDLTFKREEMTVKDNQEKEKIKVAKQKPIPSPANKPATKKATQYKFP